MADRSVPRIPVPLTDVKVISAEGESLGFDESGELCIKGPQVMQGCGNGLKQPRRYSTPRNV